MKEGSGDNEMNRVVCVYIYNPLYIIYTGFDLSGFYFEGRQEGKEIKLMIYL